MASAFLQDEGSGLGASVIHSDSPGSTAGSIVVPDAHLLFSAHFSRSGPDLVLTGADGRHYIIPGYFSSEHPPALAAPNGATLSADVIGLMAGSPAPGEYAQTQPATPPDLIGKVEKLLGNVTVIRNGVSVTLNIGDAVYKSDVIETGPDSKVGIGFPDGTALELLSNTRMALSEYSYDPNGHSNSALFTYVEGTFGFFAGKVAHTGDMKIATPVATMGIRGTTGVMGQGTDANGHDFYWQSIYDDPHTNISGSWDDFGQNPDGTTFVEVTVSQPGEMTVFTLQGPGLPPLITTIPIPQSYNQIALQIIEDLWDIIQLLNVSPHSPGAPGSPENPQEILPPDNLPGLGNGPQLIFYIPLEPPVGPPIPVPFIVTPPQQGIQTAFIWPAGLGTWDTPPGWIGDQVPVSSIDTVTIESGLVQYGNGGADNYTIQELIVDQPAELKILSGTLNVLNGLEDGGTIVVDGDPPSFMVSGPVTIAAGAKLVAKGDGALIDLINADITNAGTIAARHGGYVEIIDSTVTNEATGKIKSVGPGLGIDFSGDTFDNAGRVTAKDGGNVFFVDSPVSNETGGRLVARDFGSITFSGSVVDNAGIIAALDHGKVSFQGVDITNEGAGPDQPRGLIAAVDCHSKLDVRDSSLFNYGAVVARYDGIVRFDDAAVVNETGGVISAAYGGAIWFKDTTVTNNAEMFARDGGGLFFTGADTDVVNEAGAKIVAIGCDSEVAFRGDEIDNSGLVAAWNGGRLAFQDETVVNESTGAIKVIGFCSAATFSCDLVSNFGLILARYDGIVRVTDSKVVNSGDGEIAAKDCGTVVFCDSHVVNKLGGMIAATDFGTVVFDDAKVANRHDSTIAATDHGTVRFDYSEVVNKHDSTIMAADRGTVVFDDSCVTNSSGSTIEAEQRAAVKLDHSFVANDRGTVAAIGCDAEVDLGDSTIVGGTLETRWGGVIQTVFGCSTLDSVTIACDSYVLVNCFTSLILLGTIDNFGTIAAIGHDATVYLDNATIIGGLLSSDDPTCYGGFGALFDVNAWNGPNTSVFDTLTNDAYVLVESGANLELIGTIRNLGTIDIDEAISGANLEIDGLVTVGGSGAIKLDGGEDSIVGVHGTGATLDNDSYIVGAGNIGDGGGDLTLVNEADGKIEATGGALDPLVIDTGEKSITNDGLMEATHSGSLEIESRFVNSGNVLATHAGEVWLDANVDNESGGTVKAAHGGAVTFEGTTLDNESDALIVARGASSSVDFVGTTVHNDGGTIKAADGGTVAFDGASLINDSDALVIASGAGSSVDFDSPTVRNNGGTIKAAHDGAITFDGTTVINDSSALIVATGDGSSVDFAGPVVHNNGGTIEAKHGGSVVVDGSTIDNTDAGADDGAVAAQGNGSTVLLENGADVVVGTLTIGDKSILDIEGTSGATLDGVTVNVSDHGDIEIGAATASGSILTLDDGTKISGGTLTIDNSSSELDIEASTGATLHGVTVVNTAGGTINVDPGKATLILDDGTTITGGNLDIGSKGTLDIGAGGVNGGAGSGHTGPGATLDDVEVSAGAIEIGPMGADELVVDDGTTISGGTLTIGDESILDVEIGGPTGEGSGKPGPGATLDDVEVSGGAINVGAAAAATLVAEDGTSITGSTLTIGDKSRLDIEGSSGATLDGVTANLSDHGHIEIGVATPSGSILTLDDGTTISGGTLTIENSSSELDIEASTGATLDGVTVVNTAGGTINVDPGKATLILDDGTTITGGNLDIGSKGTLDVEAGSNGDGATLDGVNITNDGVLQVDGSTLYVDSASTIGGSGHIEITDGGTAHFADVLDQNVTFTASGGTLELDQAPGDFTITGFAKGDAIDFTNLGYSTSAYDFWESSISTLFVVDGSSVEMLSLNGSYNQNQFALEKDAAGDTELVIIKPILTGSTAETVNEYNSVSSLGVNDSATHSDVTINDLPGDLTGFDGGTYNASTGTWTGTQAQFNTLSFTAGAAGSYGLVIVANTTGANPETTTDIYTLTVDPLVPVLAAQTQAQTIAFDAATAITGISLSEADSTAGETFGVTLTDNTGLLSTTGTEGTIFGNGSNDLIIAGTLNEVNADLGLITDTNAVPGADNITVSASDIYGNPAASQTFDVTVAEPQPIIAPQAAAQTIAFDQATAVSGLSVSEGGAPATETFTVTLTDTTGLLSTSGTLGTISNNGSNDLIISGTLNDVNTDLGLLTDTNPVPGTDNITVAATDQFGNVASPQTYDVTVGEPQPVIAPQATAQTIAFGSPTSVTGLAISEAGYTPTETFTVTLSDSAGLLSISGGQGTITNNGSNDLTISGTLNEVNTDLGLVTDANTTTGPDDITVTASDGFGNTATPQTYDITVAGPLPPVIGAANTLGVVTEDSSYNTQNLISNGGFESFSYNGPPGPFYDSIPDWTFGGNYSDGFIGVAVPSHSGNAALAVTTDGQTVTASQSFATAAGETYLVTFYALNWDGSSNDTFSATFDGNTLVANVTQPGSALASGYVEYQFDTVATESQSTLQFDLTTGSTGYWFLDDVSVTPVGTPGTEARSGTIAFTDPYANDTHTVSDAPEANGYLGTFTTALTKDSTGGVTGDVTWNFTVSDSALASLGAGQTVTQTYDVTIAGADGASVVEPVTIRLVGVGPPAITINTIETNNVINAADAAAGVTIGGTAADPNGPAEINGQTVTVDILNSQDQIQDSYTTIVANDAWSLNLTPTQAEGLADGSFTVTANVSDVAGNAAPQASWALTVDELAPSIAIGTIAHNNVVDAAAAASGFAISGTATDPDGASDVNGQTLTVEILNSSNVAVDTYTTSVSNGAWSVNVTSSQAEALADGSYTVTANVSDVAGNPAPQANQALTVADEPPVIGAANTFATVTEDSSYLGNLIVNGGFETYTYNSQTNTYTIPDWTFGGYFYYPPSEGSYVHSGNGSLAVYTYTLGIGTASQSFATDVGQEYDVTFYLDRIQGATNSFSAIWDGTTEVSLQNYTNFGSYVEYQFNAIATESTSTLQFDFYTGTTGYWYLDDVSVTPVATPGTETRTGAIDFTDPVTSNTHTVGETPEGSGYLGTFTASLSQDSTGGGTGAVTWTYTVSDSALASLAPGQTVDQVYDVSINGADGEDVVQPVTVQLVGIQAPTGFVFTPDTSNLFELEDTNFLNSEGGGSIGTFAQIGGPSGDTYSVTIGGANITNGTFWQDPYVAYPAYLYTGDNTVPGASNGKVYALTVTVTDTTTGAPTAALPFDIVVGNSSANTINLETGTGNLGIAATTPTIVYGLSGNDSINATGMTAPVWLVGGPGADAMTGGSGQNSYLYGATSESTPSSADSIANFHTTSVPTSNGDYDGNNDIIDLSGLTFNGSSVSIGASTISSGKISGNSIGWIQNGSATDVYVDTSSSSKTLSSASMEIVLQNFTATWLSANNFSYEGHVIPAGVAGSPINLALSDPDAGEDIAVTLGNVPAGWVIDDGSKNADGSWTVETNDPSSLTVTTAADFVGATLLNVTETWTNADGSAGFAYVADNVEAYAPNSPIFALPGDDNLSGGATGNDTYVFAQPIGNDTIYNFNAASDKIDLVGFANVASFGDIQGDITQDGSGDAVITIGPGETITLHGIDAASLTASDFLFDQTPTLDNAGTMTIGDGAVLPLGGTIDNTGTIALNSTGDHTELQIIGSGITLEGGGQVTLSSDAIIDGSGSTGTLTNVDNTISGAGQIGSGDGSLTLINEAHGTIDANIAGTSLVLDTGTTIDNAGVLEATNGGTLLVADAVSTSGAGHAVVAGGTLEFDAASNVDVTFDNGQNGIDYGQLVLKDAPQFSGDISGFTGTAPDQGHSDSIDLGDINFNSTGFAESYNAATDVLSVTDGTDTASLSFIDFTGTFKFAADGNGGTEIFDPPAAGSPSPAASVGGPGNDHFVFAPGIGAATIANFNPHQDTIELDHFANLQRMQELGSLIASDQHGNAVIDLGHHDSIVIPGMTAADLHAVLQTAVHLH